MYYLLIEDVSRVVLSHMVHMRIGARIELEWGVFRSGHKDEIESGRTWMME